jgi:non-specific serine/threonine protein kinase/serine/threonine-protein kinase
MSRHERLESLFFECAALPPAERAALLDVRCAGDPELKAAVIDLLALDSSPDAPTLPPFVAHPGPGLAPAPPELPAAIGPYRIIRRIGEGGFGEVFEAEQERPVRRRVALKVLKAGMDTRSVLARFAAERQALALMDHPGVARVFDAGETESGRPYFAMELVAGEPITEWCERTDADLATRLGLVIAVCRAVEHAHQKGVIHRDLKPGNVLVAESDGKPIAKVIDFGIAKATLPASDGESLHTRPEDFLGTPEYMSPEQAGSGGLDVDTRTDVYSLGVLLYRLMTGELPFDSERLRGTSLEEVRRILRDEDPPRPSERAPSSRALRGDLDWIILRAMDKERTRRYASPAWLADDIERHLREEPVLAGPPDVGYRLGKLVRRRRRVVLAAAAVALAIVVGGVATAVQAIRATRAESEARRQAEAAVAVSRFLTDMFEAGNPEQNPGGHEITLREVVDRATATLGDSTFANPAVEAGIRSALASTYVGLGRYEQAAPLAERALALTERTSPAGAATTIERRLLMAQIESLKGEYKRAEARLAAIGPWVEGAGADPALRSSYLQIRGGVLGDLGRLGEADSLLTESVAIRRDRFRATGAFGAAFASGLTDLSNLKGRRGLLDESEALAREALGVARAIQGDEHHSVAIALGHLGSVHRRQGRYASAESLYRASAELDRRVVGPQHEFVGQTLGNLGQVLLDQGKPREAEDVLREVRDIVGRSVSGDHPLLVASVNSLATAIQAQGRLDEALALRLEALDMARRVFGPFNSETAVQMNNLASLYRLQKRYDAAAPLFLEADSIFVAEAGPSDPRGVTARYNVGKILLDQGRAREAEPHLREASQRAARAFPVGHPNAAVVESGLGHACVALGRSAEAESLLLDAHTTLAGTLGPAHERTRYAAEGLVSLYRDLGRSDQERIWRTAAQPAASPRTR